MAPAYESDPPSADAQEEPLPPSPFALEDPKSLDARGLTEAAQTRLVMREVRIEQTLDMAPRDAILWPATRPCRDLFRARRLVGRALDQPEAARPEHPRELPYRLRLRVGLEQLVKARPEADRDIE